MSTSQHILIIGTVWPEPNSSAAGSRILQLIHLFLSKNCRITFASASSDSEHAFDVQTLGIEKVKIELNNKSFDEFVSKLQPSIVIFDRFMIEEQFGWRVAENAPDALRILDTIDLHCLRQARQAALKEEIWSLIRKQLPSAELHIYGAYASQKVTELNNIKEGFLIKGRAEDAIEVVRKAKICLAPLRFGAGIKGKLVEAMQCGTPSVTTDIGAEAMHTNLPWNGFVVNTPEEIADAAVKLYTEENTWKQAQLNGFEIINKDR